MVKIAIAGSSVVEGDESVYTTALFKVKAIIEGLNIRTDEIELISGGSSWADHVAVTLFNEHKICKCLTLYVPADIINSEYCPKSYFGRELNARHRIFSQKCFNDSELSLKQLECLKENENVKIIVVKSGFKARNSLIAEEADYLIAVSVTPKVSGGTKDTWTKFSQTDKAKTLLFFDSNCNKIH